MKLKLNCIENENYFSGREFTKQKLGQLCSAYGVHFSNNQKRQDIAVKLREKVMSCENIVNPELLLEMPTASGYSSTNELSSS